MAVKVMGVTGFVPNAFPARHLTEQRCRDLAGEAKTALPGKIHAFDSGWRLQDCWAHKLILENPHLMPSDRSPPEDRYPKPIHAAISNIILLQRYEWVRLASLIYPEVDHFAWIEYTVLKQKNVTPEILSNYLSAIEERPYDAISLPGAWEKGFIDDTKAHGRFAGSTWVCPRKYVEPLAEAVKTVATLRTRLTGTVSWDMNPMAYVELLDMLPIRWYNGVHDETQFTHY
jgi:hypothetical protein